MKQYFPALAATAFLQNDYSFYKRTFQIARKTTVYQ